MREAQNGKTAKFYMDKRGKGSTNTITSHPTPTASFPTFLIGNPGCLLSFRPTGEIFARSMCKDFSHPFEMTSSKNPIRMDPRLLTSGMTEGGGSPLNTCGDDRSFWLTFDPSLVNMCGSAAF